ncbi:hypothetical protein LSAT2_006265 [Lamellibrachia satsuma]|nr:hypothetical protein LSAT2_006265 [Lamellibrachia satsuma]
MSDCGGKALNLCLIGQSVLQLNTAPHVCRGMWNQANSVADVNYTPSPRHLVHGDEDYEDGLTIISRLGEIENCRSPHCSNVSVVCNCEKTVQSDSHTSTVDETEHTSEQDGLKLSQLLRAFSLYERKPANRRSIGVLRNLTQSYHGNDLVNQEQLKRLERLQSHVDVGLQGTSLLIMLRLCRLDRNIVTFLRHGTLDKLLSMVECGSSRVLHRLVTAVIEQMVTSEDHAGLWLTTMVTTGLTVILQRMRMSVDDPITYGCACVLRTLARHAFFVPHILSLALDDINSLKKKHGRLRELYVEIFGQLLCHREVTDVTTMLDANIFPTLTDILKHGQW